MQRLKRLFFWSASAALVCGLFIAHSWARGSSELEHARVLLGGGDLDGAEALYGQYLDSFFFAKTARGGRALARVLAGEAPGDEPMIDAAVFPLNLMARTQFEAGEFKTALGLVRLAEQAGLPIVDTVAAAAWIENEESALARERMPGLAKAPGELASRVRRFLDAEKRAAPWTLGRGVQLLDRRGRLIGEWQPGGDLQLAQGVEPELIPLAIVDHLSENSPASIRLSIDLQLSRLALTSFGTYRGSLVVLDPQTGEVLVAVSDRRTQRREGGTPAFEQLREPASISKLITATAAMRAGLDPDELIGRMTCRGHQRFDGKFLYCPSIVGRLSGLDHAMAVSCNVAFADLGVRLGRQRMLDELRHYGFDLRNSPFAYGRILQPAGDRRQLADLSIGLEATAITPLHAALMAAVMGNEGDMPVPTLIAGEDGRLGWHPKRAEPAPGRPVLPSSWLPDILSSMEAVAEYGTASSMAPRSFQVAMKTGTASDPRYGFHTNYIGIGPLPDARFAFSIRLTDQRTSRKVRRASRYVTERFLYRLARWHRGQGFDTDDPLRRADAELDWRPGFESALITPPANFGAAAGR